jgi:hypothetical protein
MFGRIYCRALGTIIDNFSSASNVRAWQGISYHSCAISNSASGTAKTYRTHLLLKQILNLPVTWACRSACPRFHAICSCLRFFDCSTRYGASATVDSRLFRR